MTLKKILLPILMVSSSLGWAQPTSQPMNERPPRYPGPGNPEPRPEPPREERPEPPRNERPPREERPPIRPEPPRHERPPVRPEPPRHEPRPPIRPEPPRHERPPVRPEPPRHERPPIRPEPPRHERPPIRPEPPRYEPRPPVRPDPGYEYITQTVSVRRTLSNQYLDLMQLFNLHGYYSGYSVESITVRVDSGRYSQLRLLANGQVEDEGSGNARNVTLYSRYNTQIGYGLHELLLEVHGTAHVKRIQIRLRRHY